MSSLLPVFRELPANQKAVTCRARLCSAASLILVATIAISLCGCAELLKALFSPYITTDRLPNGIVGVAYAGKINANFDLLGSWWISDGQLPPGLVFKDSRFSGTPTIGGTFKFEVTVETGTEVTDWDSKQFTVLILDIATQTLPDGNVGRPYGPAALESIGEKGTPAWSIVSGDLPDGISFSPAGVLSGTPNSAGTFAFTVKVTDQDVPSRAQTRELSLKVLNPPPMPASLTPRSTAVGEPSFHLVVNGSDFVTTSTVTWNGTDRPTTYMGSTQLMAFIPASDLSAAGTAAVAVRSPAPRGGLSQSLPFAVGPASSSSIALERVSVDQADGPSSHPSISEGGRYVAFESSATNLVSGDNNGESDIFVRDTCRNARSECRPVTIRVSVTNEGTEANGPSQLPSISANGRYVAFASEADNLIAGDNNSMQDIFVRDTCIGTYEECQPLTFRVSVSSTVTEPNGSSSSPLISATGRYIAFSSYASNLISEDTNKSADIFVYDSCLGVLERCSPSTIRVSLDEQQREFESSSTAPRFSSDGRFIMFTLEALGSAPATRLTYLRDSCLSVASNCLTSTRLVSSRTFPDQQNFEMGPAYLSSNGQFIVFVANSTSVESKRSAVVVGEVCKGEDVKCGAALPLVSTAYVNGLTSAAIPSNSGRYVAFISRAANLVPDDANEPADVFVADTCYGSSACIPATWRISRTRSGSGSDAQSTDLAIAPDGEAVAFTTAATTLDPDDTNGVSDVFVYFARMSGRE
jgi:Tol biopolymer transport system component